MKRIQKDHFVFHVDVDKTKEYYLSNTLCECPSCRNLYAQIETLSEKLTAFISEFGIDICRPDESADIVMDDYIDHLFVGYTVTGHMETEGYFKTDIDGYHITISKGDNPHDWFPNEQKGPCFFVSVTGISLPWVLEEPFPVEECLTVKQRFLDKIKTFFQKKT